MTPKLISYFGHRPFDPSYMAPAHDNFVVIPCASDAFATCSTHLGCCFSIV